MVAVAVASLVAAAGVALDLTALSVLSKPRVVALVSMKGALALAAEADVVLAFQAAALAVAETVAAGAFALAVLEAVHAVIAVVAEVVCVLAALGIVLAAHLTVSFATVATAALVIDLIGGVVEAVVEAGSEDDVIDPVEIVLMERIGGALAAVAFDLVMNEGPADLGVDQAFVAIDLAVVSEAGIVEAVVSAFQVLGDGLAMAAVALPAAALLAIDLAAAHEIALAMVASDLVLVFEIASAVVGLSAIRTIVIALVANVGQADAARPHPHPRRSLPPHLPLHSRPRFHLPPHLPNRYRPRPQQRVFDDRVGSPHRRSIFWVAQHLGSNWYWAD